jgi:hypothetical protein
MAARPAEATRQSFKVPTRAPDLYQETDADKLRQRVRHGGRSIQKRATTSSHVSA